MYRLFIVGAGGFIGASLRYLISQLASRWFDNQLIYGTLIVNILGCLLIGFVMEATLYLWHVSPEIRAFFTVGVLGGLTTFSSFGYGTVSLLSSGNYGLGVLNVILNLSLGLFSVWLGKYLAQMI